MAVHGARRPRYSILLPTHNRADVLPLTGRRAAVWNVLERRVALSDEMLLRLARDGGPDGLGADRLFESYAQIEKLARLADELVEDYVGWKLLRRARGALEEVAPPGTLRGRLLRRVMELAGGRGVRVR